MTSITAKKTGARRLRVGIAGYGAIGPRRHQFIDQHPALKVVAVSDASFTEERSSHEGVERFKNYKRLLECDLDALFVCLPNDIAPDAVLSGIEKGLHVFCEKPPGRAVGDIRRVIEAEKKNPKLKLKYGFNHRYHDSVREALRIIESGEFGKIINLRGVYGKSAFIPWPRPSHKEMLEDPKYWRTSRAVAGGGILLDQGIHMVDLMRAFAGDFTDVKSFVKNSFWNHDVEDNAYALMQTRSGVVAMLHSTATQWRHRFSLEIHLEGGALILSGILSGTKSYGEETLTIARRREGDKLPPSEETRRYEEDNSWRDEIFEFADCILNDKPVVVGSSREALNTMELVYRIYCADSQWRDRWRITMD